MKHKMIGYENGLVFEERSEVFLARRLAAFSYGEAAAVTQQLSKLTTLCVENDGRIDKVPEAIFRGEAANMIFDAVCQRAVQPDTLWDQAQSEHMIISFFESRYFKENVH